MIQYTFTQSVKVLSKAGCISQIGEVLKESGYKKAMLIHGKGIAGTQIPSRVTESLEQEGIQHISYTTIQANVMSDLICETVMRTVAETLPVVLKDGTDIHAREKMQAAAAIGGWGLYMCGSHVGHSLAHVLGGSLHIVHGAACAYGLPGVLEIISTVCTEKVKKIGEILGAKYTGAESPQQIGQLAAEQYKEFCKKIGLPPVNNYDLSIAELKNLARQVTNETFAVFSPVPITEERALVLLQKALNKKP